MRTPNPNPPTLAHSAEESPQFRFCTTVPKSLLRAALTICASSRISADYIGDVGKVIGARSLISCTKNPRMASLNLHAMGTSSLQPVALTARVGEGQARIASSCTTSDGFSSRPGRLCRLQHLSCRGSFLSPGSRGPLRLQRLQALSFQMVTADHDNSGEQNPGPSAAEPSTQAIDSSSSSYTSSSEWEGREDVRQMLVDSWQGLQEGVTELRHRGVVETAKQGFQEAKEKVRTLDAKQVVTDFRSSPLSIHGARWWRTSDPWIKWPLAIFIPFYLLVTIIFGVAVSQDLLPLWILGPVGTSIVIRQVCRIADLSCAVIEKTTPQREQLTATTLALYRDAKEGTLPEHAKLLAETKLGELKERVTSKRSEIALWVESGQAATDTRSYLGIKLLELWEWLADIYADYLDWWRPKGRTLARVLKRIF